MQEAEVDESSDVVVEPAKTIPVHDRSVMFHWRKEIWHKPTPYTH